MKLYFSLFGASSPFTLAPPHPSAAAASISAPCPACRTPSAWVQGGRGRSASSAGPFPRRRRRRGSGIRRPRCRTAEQTASSRTAGPCHDLDLGRRCDHDSYRRRDLFRRGSLQSSRHCLGGDTACEAGARPRRRRDGAGGGGGGGDSRLLGSPTSSCCHLDLYYAPCRQDAGGAAVGAAAFPRHPRPCCPRASRNPPPPPPPSSWARIGAAAVAPAVLPATTSSSSSLHAAGAGVAASPRPAPPCGWALAAAKWCQTRRRRRPRIGGAAGRAAAATSWPEGEVTSTSGGVGVGTGTEEGCSVWEARPWPTSISPCFASPPARPGAQGSCCCPRSTAWSADCGSGPGVDLRRASWKGRGSCHGSPLCRVPASPFRLLAVFCRDRDPSDPDLGRPVRPCDRRRDLRRLGGGSLLPKKGQVGTR